MTQKKLEEDLRELLTRGQVATQEEICAHLQKAGHDINQSRASRLLRKIGAVKSKNEYGQIVYRLPKEPAPPTSANLLLSLIIDIVANEQLIVIHCQPGSAAMVARLLDHHMEKAQIIGTVAGDDTILVVPKSTQHTKETMQSIKKVLAMLY
ncbi:MAG: arginine repressor [Proteobacteria bacterium]|nr:arginine repressor [Pseudomonadota bacterium]